ncbi:MAG: DUF669 domain-containing protein [Bacillota bacterium]
MNPRHSLSQILNNRDHTQLRLAWEKTQAAGDPMPLPAGEYIVRIVRGELHTARTGTTGFKLTFEVLEGEFIGRRFWHDIWLTPAAIPMAKRDLGRLGITDLEQLDEPLPQGIRVKAKVVLRRDDDGTERNRVRTFEMLSIDPPEKDAFAPDDDGEKGTDDVSSN